MGNCQMNKTEKIAQTLIDLIHKDDSLDIDSTDKHPTVTEDGSVKFTMTKDVSRDSLNPGKHRFSKTEPYYYEEHTVTITSKKVFFDEDEENP